MVESNNSPATAQEDALTQAESKKEYQPPMLEDYGKFRDLTRASIGPAPDGSGDSGIDGLDDNQFTI